MEHRESELKGERGIRIWLQAWLPANPRAAVALVHGLGEHSGRHRNLVEYLLRRGYALYAMDYRGHGRAGGARGHVESFDDYLADTGGLLGWAGGEQPQKPLFLLGLSLGGLIVLKYALERPQGLQGVIVSAPGLRRKFEVPAHKLLLARLMSRIWPAFAQTTGLLAEALSHDPQVAAQYRADPLVHATVTARFFTEVSRAQGDVLASASRLRLPILFLQGSDDQFIDALATREFFESTGSPDKTLRWYEGFFHEVFNEVEREQPLADLAGWLDAHVPAPER